MASLAKKLSEALRRFGVFRVTENLAKSRLSFGKDLRKSPRYARWNVIPQKYDVFLGTSVKFAGKFGESTAKLTQKFKKYITLGGRVCNSRNCFSSTGLGACVSKH